MHPSFGACGSQRAGDAAESNRFWHPIHLHGHHVKVLARNGQKLDTPSWRDTVLLAPRDSLELAFVADNPGKWLVHCHVLEHHAEGWALCLR
ncbi:MAG: multicopper oxidase domain-containing protein [Burkholderiaceae bacterium]